MDVLIDLVSYINQRRLRSFGQGKSQVTQLYNGIRRGRLKNDQEALSALYGNNPHGVTYFNSTKRKLKGILYNLCLNTEPKNKDYWEKLHLIEKKILVANQLVLRGMTQSAIALMEEVLSDSQKLHFTKGAREAAFKLSTWYAATGHRAKYKKRYELEVRLARTLEIERQAESYYFALFNEMRHQKGIPTDLIQQARIYLNLLSDCQLETFQFQMFFSYISVIYFELENESEQVINICQKALDFFNSLPFDLPDRSRRIFTFKMAPALLHQRKYHQALLQLEAAETLSQKNTLNWASIHELKAIIGYHSRDLSIVEDAIGQLRSSRSTYALKKEEVLVLEGYLAFLKKEDTKSFKVGKFLNEVPQYTADKKGMNINILIIQILIFLRNKKLSPVIDRMDALRTYSYRYLKHDPATRRSDLFIRLLLLATKYSFDPRMIQKKAGSLLEQLRLEPRYLRSIDIEIVPYEWLWDQIMQFLEED